MATTFNKLNWANGAAPAINAANLQRFDDFLAAIAQGGNGSVRRADVAADAELVNGKDLTAPIDLNRGLIGACGGNVPLFPDKPAGTIYKSLPEWTGGVEGWTLSGGTAGSVSVVGGRLRFVKGAANELCQKTINIPAGTTMRVRGRISAGAPQNAALALRTDGNNVVSKPIPVDGSIFTLDFITTGIVTSQIIYCPNASSPDLYALDIEGIYFGDGSYSSKDLDLSGNDKHASIFGATPVEGGFSFDGVNDYLQVPGIASSIYTLSAVIKTGGSVANQDIIYLTAGSMILVLRLDTLNRASLSWIDNGGSLRTITSPSPINLLTDTDVKAVLSPSLFSIFVNGVSVASTSTNTNFLAIPGTSARIGANATGLVNYFNGTIRYPRIYNRALTAAEIWELYRNPAGNAVDNVPRSFTPAPHSVMVRGPNGGTELSMLTMRGVASADPNTLDAYEEGTFTPSVIGRTTAGVGTYSIQVGYYTRIGRMVYFQVALTWSAHTGTGNMDLAGLPFTPANVNSAFGGVMLYHDGLSLTAGNILIGTISPNDTSIYLRQVPTGGGSRTQVPMDTAASLFVSGFYFV